MCSSLHAPITDEGVTALARCKDLSIVKLNGTQVSDEGVRAVATAHALHARCSSGEGPEPPLVRRLVEAVCFYDTMTTPAGDSSRCGYPVRLSPSPKDGLDQRERDDDSTGADSGSPLKARPVP